MKKRPLKLIILSFFKKKKRDFLPQNELSKLLPIDKAKLSGYLEAMVDYGDLILIKSGTSKLYSPKDRGKDEKTRDDIGKSN